MRVNRHALLLFLRLLLAVGVMLALPYSHSQWGEPYPGDGQHAFGIIFIFMMIGYVAAAVFIGFGSLGQFLLRRRPAHFTVIADCCLFILFAGVLAYGGITATYHDAQAGESAERTGMAR